MTNQYFVYILANRKDGALYIGMTNNLERRMFEHKNDLGSKYARRYSANLFFQNYFVTGCDLSNRFVICRGYFPRLGFTKSSRGKPWSKHLHIKN